MSDSFRIEEAAAAWVARKDREDWSEEDDAALTAWIQESLAHRIAYLRLNAVWQQTLQLGALAQDVPADPTYSDPVSLAK